VKLWSERGAIEVDIPKDEWDKSRKEYDEQSDAFNKARKIMSPELLFKVY
jgi:hypothetical protein